MLEPRDHGMVKGSGRGGAAHECMFGSLPPQTLRFVFPFPI